MSKETDKEMEDGREDEREKVLLLTVDLLTQVRFRSCYICYTKFNNHLRWNRNGKSIFKWKSSQ